MSMLSPLDLLARAVEEVLEKMFFIFTDLPSDEADRPVEPSGRKVIRAGLGFQGAWQGRIELCFDPGLGRVLAANFLGQDEDAISDELVMDMAKEITNIAAGRFLVLLEPDQGLSMELPEAELVEEMAISTWLSNTGGAVVLESEEGRFFCRLLMEPLK